MLVEQFISRWQDPSGTERANYQLFLTELAELLDLPRPDPASNDTAENAYVFERRVTFAHGDGSESRGFIDLYKRGCFICEAKQTSQELDSGRWDSAMQRARGQAESYARALPAEEGRPPFLIVTDVGRNIELYSEFSRSGATYVPFPDPRSHRIRLEDLADEAIRERLIKVWTEPLSLDPARQTARVTREIAGKLATLAKSLEQNGQPSEITAAFLMRCLFTMFAEDVGLLPKQSFTELLESLRDHPQQFVPLVQELWQAMNRGGFSAGIRSDVLRFNGGIFADPSVLPLDKTQIDLLIEAARADWRHVEPAIFGTLLERALDPVERHKLGAHYTPRAYVERLVMPTVIEPLREAWQAAQVAALTLDKQGKHDAAVKQIREFHHRLCHIRVLDPACGSGNFLYVTLEHMKRLEGEVLNTLEEMGETQAMFEMEGVSVDPHQLLGIELNPRAAKIAEAVLWIGYLQWHYRTHGNVNPPEPVIKDFHNIENRDAVLSWDDISYVTDEQGKPVTRWDGRTYKTHPVTDKQVPDESARIPQEQYHNPRKAEWPEADYIVGNPPFIGTARMRDALGDGYTEALRKTYPRVPESADFVMYWWHHAADLARENKAHRFGFITTNSLRQTFNRRVVQHHLENKKPLSLVFAIPDHPWVDSSDGAAVRIAMTVGEVGNKPGVLNTVSSETRSADESLDVEITIITKNGKLFSDLHLDADMGAVKGLTSNMGISNKGFEPGGDGFVVTPEQASSLGLGHIKNIENFIRNYCNGRDLTQYPRRMKVIDLYGLGKDEVRSQFPEVYQWLHDQVKPERDHNRDIKLREQWWLHRRLRKDLRRMLVGIKSYIVTVETAKHRTFQLLSTDTSPSNLLICIVLPESWALGVLSSRIHVSWSLVAGGTLEDRPRYNKTRCFETFPFPETNDKKKEKIRSLAEQLDAHRKRQQELHLGLTMTGMYNVLEKFRKGEELTDKDKIIHEQGLVSVLAQLHDELDTAVFEAYGWQDLAPALVGKPGGTTPLLDKPEEQAEVENELLKRLVALNAERAAEEKRGLIRWLRPEFQNPGGESSEQLEGMPTDTVQPAVAVKKQPWPKSLPEQVQAIREQLDIVDTALTAEQLARLFTRGQKKRVAELLQTLVELGQVQSDDGDSYHA